MHNNQEEIRRMALDKYTQYASSSELSLRSENKGFMKVLVSYAFCLCFTGFYISIATDSPDFVNSPKVLTTSRPFSLKAFKYSRGMIGYCELDIDSYLNMPSALRLICCTKRKHEKSKIYRTGKIPKNQ